MNSLQVFSIASQQAQWLAERQTTVASNIANAATPGYKAVDVVPFSAVLQNRQNGLRVTNPKHLNISGSTGSAPIAVRLDSMGEISHSGNSVSIDHELVKGAEIARAYSLNTNVVKSFHRFLLMSVRG